MGPPSPPRLRRGLRDLSPRSRMEREPRLAIVRIEGEGVAYAHGLHDHEARAVGEAPDLVFPLEHELERPTEVLLADPELHKAPAPPQEVVEPPDVIQARPKTKEGVRLVEDVVGGHEPPEPASSQVRME